MRKPWWPAQALFKEGSSFIDVVGEQLRPVHHIGKMIDDLRDALTNQEVGARARSLKLVYEEVQAVMMCRPARRITHDMLCARVCIYIP